MVFQEVIDRFYQLSAATAKDDTATPGGFDPFSKKAITEAFAPTPATDALTKFLTGLPQETLRAIEVLMYAGRDGGDVMAKARDLSFDPENYIMANTIAGKSPRSQYVATGIAALKGMSLEQFHGKIAAMIKEKQK